jgi:hypothetical protein
MRQEGLYFQRAEDVEALIRNDFVSRGGLFFDSEHGHLTNAHIGVFWTAQPEKDKGKAIIGRMELLKPGNPRTWAEAQRRAYLHLHFGPALPVYLMTLFAPWCHLATDREYFGLIDHELSHASVKKDEYGVPQFNDETGEPIWAKRPHDVETFVGTTERWGAEDTGAGNLVRAALQKPRFFWVPGRPLSAGVCGSCGK